MPRRPHVLKGPPEGPRTLGGRCSGRMMEVVAHCRIAARCAIGRFMPPALPHVRGVVEECSHSQKSLLRAVVVFHLKGPPLRARYKREFPRALLHGFIRDGVTAFI